MKLQIRYIVSALLVVLLVHKTFAQCNYTIKNITDKYKHSVYGLTKSNGRWLVTACDKKNVPYTDIYATDSVLSFLEPFAGSVMTVLDEGMPCITSDGTIMYYTTVEPDYSNDGKINTRKLKIAIAINDKGNWVYKRDFPYVSNDYRTAHLAISRNGEVLIFSSDKPGGQGGMDLYYCTYNGTNWSEPRNLAELNSASNDVFPSFDENDNLIFSSDRQNGLGGLDLYTATKKTNGYDKPIHLGVPLNSEFDDFSLYSENNLQSGTLSTNRFKKGKDDVMYFESARKDFTIAVYDKHTHIPLPYVIVQVKDKAGQVVHQGMTGPNGELHLDNLEPANYMVQGMLNDISTNSIDINEADIINGKPINKELTHNDPRFTLSGVATNATTREGIEGVNVVCRNVTSDRSKDIATQNDGKFFFQLEQNSDFEVQGQKRGWLSSEMSKQTTKGLDRTTQLYVNLELKIEKPKNNSTIRLRQINYDYNKATIRKDAAVELDRVVNLLNDYPDMSIELSSHTDSRGTDDYNLQLSQQRANAAKQYLVSKGINSKRLSAKGYGETRVLNTCKNGVECTEQEHELNRRTEFTVLSCSSCQ